MKLPKLTKKRGVITSAALAIAIIFSIIGLSIEVKPHYTGNSNATIRSDKDRFEISIGTNEAYAAETPDYSCDGVADNVQFQQALDALPAIGGKLRILSGTYAFTALTTVTRAIGDVVIEGVGSASLINCDGATAVFTAGGNNWKFSDIASDAGGFDMGATTNWQWINVTEGATFYAIVTEGQATFDALDATTAAFGEAGFTQQTATGDGTTTVDWTVGNKFYFTFGAFNEVFTFTAPSNECNLLLVLEQDGVGGRTATFPVTVFWAGGVAPTLSLGVGDVDIITFYYDGTNYFGCAALDFS